jgi:hypothetical protein
MEIRILYFPGCPNWRKAADRVRAALAELGRADAAVDFEDVSRSEEHRSEWRGSPTILIDGVDRFGSDGEAAGLSDDAVPGLDTCRVYVTAAGLEGAPSVDQLRIALSRAAAATTDHEAHE